MLHEGKPDGIRLAAFVQGIRLQIVIDLYRCG